MAATEKIAATKRIAMKITYIVLKVTHKDVPYIDEKAAQRVFPMQGVEECVVHGVYDEMHEIQPAERDKE